MLKQHIKFKDYNDQDREITEYFHLNEAEIVKMQAASVNGIQQDMQDAILSNDAKRVLDFIEGLVLKSYGKKSQDGLNFEKTPEILAKFVSSAYYSDFLLGLIEDNGRKGEEFVQGIMPAKLVERALAQVQGQAQEAGEVDRTVYGQSARETFAAAQAQKESGNALNLDPNSIVQNNAPQSETVLNVRQNPVTNELSSEEFEKFQQWKAQQNAAQTLPGTVSDPNAFRVREEEPTQNLHRPPHEQIGNSQ